MKNFRAFKFGLNNLKKAKKSVLTCCIIAVFAQVTWQFFIVYLPRMVLDNLVAQVTHIEFILSVGGTVTMLAFLGLIKGYAIDVAESATGLMSSFSTLMATAKKEITMNYELLESPAIKMKMEKARRARYSSNSPAHNIPCIAMNLCINMINFALYGSILLLINPIILLYLGFSTAIAAILLHFARKFESKTRSERSELAERIQILMNYITNNEYTKEIKVYSMAGLFRHLLHKTTNKYHQAELAVAKRTARVNIVSAVLALLRDSLAYVLLLTLVINGSITLGEFVFLFAVVGMFSDWIHGINVGFSELYQASNEAGDIMDFLQVPDDPYPLIHTENKQKMPPIIRLANVTFKYPNSKTNIFEDLSLEIKPNESVAIVGNNGAGKSTLVKLISGLYHPTDGEVFVNNISSKAFNRESYFSLFSVVFQDIHLIPESIALNVSQVTENLTNYDRVNDCLKLAGLYDKVQNLPQKEKTLLVPQVNIEGVDLSGGERQKLAIARVLYKDSPIIVLDEPTAALDPIAENHIYAEYSKITKGKTAIFISHRLASTKFCDKIFFIENGKIAEYGSHEELMNLGKQYAGMFNIQSIYYKD